MFDAIAGPILQGNNFLEVTQLHYNVFCKVCHRARGAGVGSVIDISRFSSLPKLVKTTAYVMKFIDALKGQRTDTLSADSIAQAQTMWENDVQLSLKSSSKFSDWESLT